MAVTATPAMPQTPNNKCTIIQNSDSTNKITIFTAGSNGSRLDTLSVATTDTSNNQLNIWLTDGTTEIQLDSIVVTAGYGTNATNRAVDLLSLMPAAKADGDLVRQMWMKSGCILKIAANAAVTSNKYVYVYAEGADL